MIPFSEKYRPKTLDEVCLDVKTLKEFKSYVELKAIPNHLLFLGGAGLGKTTIAKILAETLTDGEYLYVAASKSGGIDVLRNEIASYCSFMSSTKKIVVLDEADGLSTVAQQGLRNVLDDFASTSTFILTANYKTRIIDPIHSRCQIFDFQNTDKIAIAKRCVTILKAENVVFKDKDGLVSLINKCYPDIRKVVVFLQKCSLSGTFVYDEGSITSSEESDNLIALTKQGNLKDISKDIIGAGCDYVALYKVLFDRAGDISETHDLRLRLTIAEYLYRHSTIPDQEINFKACLLAILQITGAANNSPPF